MIYSYRIMTEKGWSKRGIRVEAENASEAAEKAIKKYKEKGYNEPMLFLHRVVKN